MSAPQPNDSRPAGLLVAAGAVVCSFCIYFFAIDPHAPSLRRNNFVLDADIWPVAQVIAGESHRNLERHPLYTIFLGWPGSLVDRLLDDPMRTGKIASAAGAVAAGVVGFGYLAELLGSRAAAAWLCALASSSASVWLFAAIPETHVFNYLAVVSSFALLGRMSRADAALRVRRHTTVAILAAVFLMGITLTNVFYVAAAYGLGVLRTRLPRARRVRWLAVFVAGVVLLFAACCLLQLQVHPDDENLLKTPTRPFDTRFLRWDRVPNPVVLAAQARIFLLDGIVASPPRVDLVLTLTGFQQMIQLGSIGRSQVLILGYLAFALAVLLSRRSRASYAPDGLLAVLFIVFNLVLHFFFRGNGQPFIFSIHTVFPLVVLLALVYRQSDAAPKQLLIGGLVYAVVLYNVFFMSAMNDLVSRRCVEEKLEVFRICTRWEPPTIPALQ